MERAGTMTAEALVKEEVNLQRRVFKIAGEGSGKVLIVEDEAELAEVLEFNLLSQGFEVLVAADGLEACRVIGRERPELILLDLMLPLLDGWELCRMVRSHQDPVVAKTPIIMLSALGSSDDRLKGYDLGADLYLPKPYTMKEVIIKTHQLIQQRHEMLALTRQVDSLQNWSELQDHWQQALFHELRNQLTVISGMALQLRKNSDMPQERSEQFTEQISSSSHYLGSLAENYLLVRQVEDRSQQLQGEPILLQDLLADLEPLFSPLAEQKSCHLQLECSEPVLLNLHPVGLKIVLSSLLDNALKYSMLDGWIDLSVLVEPERVIIRLQDDGPGIAGNEREKVFDKFYRGSSSGDTPPGSGLGLYMARTLTEAMGGSLQLVDGQQAGCCFELCLPRPV